MLPDIFRDNAWQMPPGERAAIKSILVELAPKIAIEIGTGQGGSLRHIAAYAEQVHSFDVSDPPPELTGLSNVTFHIGDSHELLAGVLAQLAEQGANVDFALVDGDHSAQGVKRDVEDLLASPAVRDSIIVLHDTANPEVRAGLDSIDYLAWPRLVWVDLDWMPGFVFRQGPSQGEAWAGLGMLIVNAARGREADAIVVARSPHPTADVADLERRLAELTSSRSWRLTRPLRALKSALRP